LDTQLETSGFIPGLSLIKMLAVDWSLTCVYKIYGPGL